MKTLNGFLTVIDFIVPPLSFYIILLGVPGDTTTAESSFYSALFNTTIAVGIAMLFLGVISAIFIKREKVTNRFSIIHLIAFLLLIAIFVISIASAVSEGKFMEESVNLESKTVECDTIKPSTMIKDPDWNYSLNIDNSRFKVAGCYLMPEYFSNIKNDEQYFVVLTDNKLNVQVAFNEFLLIGQNYEYDNYVNLSEINNVKTELQKFKGFIISSESSFSYSLEEKNLLITKSETRYLGNENLSEVVNIDL